MPTSKSKKSFLRWGFKAEAERIALHYREQLGLQKHSPLPARLLAEHLGVKILTPSEIPGITANLLEILLKKGKDYWSAAIYIKEDRKFIIHNPMHSLSRQESNLMHEIAHAHLEHELANLQSALSGCILPLRKYDEVQEAEAECLGACLQLPKDALFHYHHIDKKSQKEIATLFNASNAMVRYRLSMSGVLNIRYKPN